MSSKQKQVFVTSDWHLGGSTDEIDDRGQLTMGASIFRSTNELVMFLDDIKSQMASFEGETELVINGDMVDFLAPDPDEGYVPISWQTNSSVIRERLRSIEIKSVDSNGRCVFEALRDLASCGCKITVLLGNHDIELCLPEVRDYFSTLVSGTANGIRLIHDGEAYVVGRMIVEHGNRYDRVNAIDYSRLRQERSHISRGLKVDRDDWFFDPPVGSCVVINQVNPRLPYVPFFNLLKPELEAAIPLMLAFYPESRSFWSLVFDAASIKYRSRNNSPKSRPGFLSGGEVETYQTLNEFLRDSLGNDAQYFIGPAQRSGEMSGGEDSSASLASKLAERVAVSFDQTCPWDIYNILTETSNEERLKKVRVALGRVCNDMHFSQIEEKAEYLSAASELIEVGGKKVVVFGHTHFPKEIQVSGGLYLNAGTWADVMKLPDEIRSPNAEIADAAITKFLDDMKCKNYEPYTVRHRSYVHAIVDRSGDVIASLKFYSPRDSGGRIHG